jgi:hypothetical protein
MAVAVSARWPRIGETLRTCDDLRCDRCMNRGEMPLRCVGFIRNAGTEHLPHDGYRKIIRGDRGGVRQYTK